MIKKLRYPCGFFIDIKFILKMDEKIRIEI